MKVGRKLAALAGAAVLSAGLGIGLAAASGAATLSCTTHESCGGADLKFSGHGPLSLSVLDRTSINGGFGVNNERVGFNTSGLHNGTQDFTVFQTDTQVTGHGGVYGFGDYTVMFTPGGVLPLNDTTPGDTATDAGNGASVAYCISVEDTYPVVNGHTVQRWALVLRNCFAWPGTTFRIGNKATDVAGTVHLPNLYQQFAPTETSDGFLKFQDVALNSAHFRHGFGGHNFVIDDRGFGGPGTWGIVYPEKDVTQNADNQEFTIIGCSKPVTVFNSQYFDCAGV